MNKNDYDFSLATRCAEALAKSLDIGCAVCFNNIDILADFGYSIKNKKIYFLTNNNPLKVLQAHINATEQAKRFGGKYIYNCPLGMTYIVSLITDNLDIVANIIAGPFLMIDKDEFINFEINSLDLSEEEKRITTDELDYIPCINTEKVAKISDVLFMATGFINNMFMAKTMLEKQDSEIIQGNLNSYIATLKSNPELKSYPFETEKLLQKAILKGERAEANLYLNEIFGHIFFVAAGDLNIAKSRLLELFVLMSRSAIDSGADESEILVINQNNMEQLHEIYDVEQLCIWSTKVITKLIDSIFNVDDAKHASVIRKTINYLNANYDEKITLEGAADKMYLSASYFSRLFKKEIGDTFNNYLNKIRVEESKKLLCNKEIKLSQIALMVGYEDQSYFTKVFKKHTGLSPLKYRDSVK